jgi:hypothetical protein
MLNVVMLIVVMLNVVMLSVVMPSCDYLIFFITTTDKKNWIETTKFRISQN